MPDLPVALSRPDLGERLAAAVDREGKLIRAFAELGPVADRDVLLVDEPGSHRERDLQAVGARVQTAALGDLERIPAASVDVVVAPWVGFVAGDEAFDRQLSAARHVARPEGRLLVVQDYGRDDVRPIIGLPAGMSGRARDRDEWFLRRDFRIRVVHCWWTFDSIEEAEALLSDAFGEAGVRLGASLTRPRLAHKIAVYHRDL